MTDTDQTEAPARKILTPSPLEQEGLRILTGAASSHAKRATHLRAQAEEADRHSAEAQAQAEEHAEALLFAAGLSFVSFALEADGTVTFEEPAPEPEAFDPEVDLDPDEPDEPWAVAHDEGRLEFDLPDDHED